MKGNTAILKCEIPSEVRDHVRVTSWLHEEGTSIEIFPEKQPRGKYTLLDQTGGHLLVHHTSTYDTYKKYTCKTEHNLTGIRRRSLHPARLSLSEPKGPVLPRMLEPLTASGRISRHAWVGEHVIMPCVASGFPVPETTWFRVDGVGLRQVLPTRRINYHLEVMIIQDLSVEDSGVYVCIVNNTIGSERVEVNLTVRSPLGARVHPLSQVVDLNKEAVFGCSVVGWPVERLSWLKDGYPLQTGQRYQTYRNGTLRISSVQEGDEGSYQCVAKNAADFAQATGSLRLGDAMPTLLFKFSEQTLQPGPSVSLKCIAKGNPPPSIHWLLDDFPIPQSERFIVGQYVTIHDDVISHVNISHVEPVDGGAYSCQAGNHVGAVGHTARLNVYGPPFVRSSPMVRAIEGRFFLVSCPASGYPIERIAWQKDGYELPSDPRQKVFPNGTLAIEKTYKIHDEGYYSCTAFGPGQKSSTGTVQVQVITPPNIMPFLFPNKVLTEGMRSAVSCQILEGNLPINFTWSKNGKSILVPGGGNKGRSSNYVLLNGVSVRSNDEYSSTLIIDRLEFMHRGNYTCKATNAAGVSSHTAELAVNVPPKWIQEPQDVQAIEGQDVVLPCLVEGYPQPTTVWTRTNDFGALNYQVLPLGLSFQQLPNGSLSVASISKEAEGSYTCSAQNGVRTGITKTISISVNAPPRFDEKTIRLSVRKGEKASLICEASGDIPMDIFWSRNAMAISQDDDARFTILGHKRQNEVVSRFIISPVLDQDRGQITCEAVNRFGRDQKNFLLSIEDVPSPPTDVRLCNIKSRSLEISWKSPHDGNSMILNYVVEYSNLPVGAALLQHNANCNWVNLSSSRCILSTTPADRREHGERQRRKMTAPGDAASLIVQNLRPGTRYKFRVSAENQHGMSQASPAVTTRMMEEAPTAQPRNLEVEARSSTELEIGWDAPPKDHWNSELLCYKIGFKEVGNGPSMAFVDVRPSNRPRERFVLGRGLKKFTSYQIMVQPYNKEGVGPPSNSMVATTMEDVPSGPPENVHCQSRSSNSILLEWSKPKRTERNGIIRGYWIEYYPRILWYGTTRS